MKTFMRPTRSLKTILIRYLSRTPNRLEQLKVIDSPLTDTFARHHTYLRISLTERCNLRCLYCMPADGVKLTKNPDLLTTNEIINISKLFASIGVTKIRLTGGEPTVRKDLITIIESLKRIDGMKSVAMTTNGIMLTRQLVALQRAGLDGLNISLDTLKKVKFEEITRRKGWERVIMGIDLAIQLGYRPVKVNCVMIKGFNDNEILDFVEFTRDRNVDVRFIEYMPFTGNRWESEKMLSYKDMLETIRKVYPDIGPMTNQPNDTSKAWKIPGFQGQLGFITSMSEHFCGACNRLRITADGNLKVCLFGNTEISLRDALRSGCSHDDLVALISSAVDRKKKQHAVHRREKTSTIHNRQYKTYNETVPPLMARGYSTTTTDLSHVDIEGNCRMVDVSDKCDTSRVAVAQATVNVPYKVARLIHENNAKKGDVLSVAQLAGIMGAKKTADLIPLCHNIPLTKIDIEITLNLDGKRVEIVASVCSYGKTGVEMEALCAVSLAALTVYDMCKAVSQEMVISNIHLISKGGGSSADYGKQQPRQIRRMEMEPVQKGDTVVVGNI